MRHNTGEDAGTEPATRMLCRESTFVPAARERFAIHLPRHVNASSVGKSAVLKRVRRKFVEREPKGLRGIRAKQNRGA